MYEKRVKVGLFVLLAVALAWLVIGGLPGLNPVQLVSTTADSTGPIYSLTDRFQSESINSRMWVSQAFELDHKQSLGQTVAIILKEFTPNASPTVIPHGNSAHVPVGWAYIKLHNVTDKPQMLVLSMPHYRCYQATLWVGRGGRFEGGGTVRRTTPVGERFFPFLDLSFPVTVPPRATMPLLLRTETLVGFHELNVRLSQRSVYLQNALLDSIRDGAQVIVCALLAAVALLIGWRSANRLLLTFGGYMFTLALAFSCQFGYLYLLTYPVWTSINTHTMGTLMLLTINITLHPFFYEFIKPTLHHPRRYQRWAVGICVANAVVIGLHLLPYRYYGAISYPVNLAMTNLSTLNVGWVLYFSVLAYRRAGIWSMLIVCLMAFTPTLINQLLVLAHLSDGQYAFRQPVSHPLIIILALGYLTFEQFRKEVITRQLLQRQVRQVVQDGNAMRREEIEGIGRDLHDQVGNTLASALGYLSRLPVDTQKPRDIIVNAIRELRFLSHNLVKDDDRPLTEKVETLVSRINDFSPIAFSFADYTQHRIDQLSIVKQQNLYRIIQELLTNVIRHSQATQASVQFFADETGIDVSVEDDGIGFELPLSTDKGIGIQNVYKRAALSAIEVQFDAAPNGTSVLLRTSLYDADPNHTY